MNLVKKLSSYVLVLLISFSLLAAYVLADIPQEEKDRIIQERGLSQPPTLHTNDEAVQAVCNNLYITQSSSNSDEQFRANYTSAVQCVSCARLAVSHKIPQFTAESCTYVGSIGQTASSYGHYGPDAGAASTRASEYCTNTCLPQPNLVPDQAALAQGQIQVIDAEKGQYDIVAKSGLENQLGSTCGLPRPGLDGDTTVMKCCVVQYDQQDLAGQLVQTPKFGCAPGWTNGAIDLAKGFIGNFTAGARTAGKLLQGKFGDALKTSLDTIPGFPLVKTLFSKNKADNSPFCLSQIPTIIGGKVLDTTPGTALQLAGGGLKKKPCREGALPAINGIITTDLSNPSCTCSYPEEVKDATGAYLIGQGLCDRYLAKSADYQACKNCTNGIYTGIGCIGTNLPGITRSVLGFGVSIGGGLALLSVMYAAFVIQTSRGNPERIKKGRDYLNSSLIGLMIIIFSVLILQVIGIDILRLPGFTRP